MTTFEKFPSQRAPEDELISSIFPHEGRKGFHKKVEQALEASQKGGFRKGTPMFIKSVVGPIKFKPDEFRIIKREINKEAKKIEKEELEREELLKEAVENSPSRKLNLEERDKLMLDGARKNLEEEFKRSGGVDPNE